MKDEEMRSVHKREREKTLFKDFMLCPFNVKLRIAVDLPQRQQKRVYEISIVLHFGSVRKIEGVGTSCGRKTGR
ncbi:hypothetical protein CEXT_690351 [Caerostris extrusa]|uniref:Uncharacterized protein n=1 Tax=Caerostris extrusa TaxID=172846 RepID=A0AAV4S930_CAEEX|nr:hypothetical protein CEXT_690351 [Caerostris extrusa]